MNPQTQQERRAFLKRIEPLLKASQAGDSSTKEQIVLQVTRYLRSHGPAAIGKILEGLILQGVAEAFADVVFDEEGENEQLYEKHAEWYAEDEHRVWLAVLQEIYDYEERLL